MPKKKIGYFQRRKPKAFLLQNYIGVDHALVAVQKRVAAMKNPTKKQVIQLIKDYRARVHEYAEAIYPGASKALWTDEQTNSLPFTGTGWIYPRQLTQDYVPTIVVKSVSKKTFKRLEKLKAQLDCNARAELLEKLSVPDPKVSFTKNEISEMKQGVTEFLALSEKVSKKWRGSPSTLEDFRASRRHID